MRRLAALGLALVAACGADPVPADTALEPEALRSGYTFLQPETQALQDDDFSNPGFLWVDRGEALFAATPGSAPSCASCHDANEAMRGVAARYPAVDAESGTLMNLEGRINLCRERHQSLPPLDYESEDLLSLSAFVASQSRGMPVSVPVGGEVAKAALATGETYFYTQRGQFDLSCHQCHDLNWGRQLRGDMISQGHGNGFPAYRLEWESLGSLHRRLRDCDTGVRAEPLPFGDPTYVAVELYLAHRAAGLYVESPAVRR